MHGMRSGLGLPAALPGALGQQGRRGVALEQREAPERDCDRGPGDHTRQGDRGEAMCIDAKEF